MTFEQPKEGAKLILCSGKFNKDLFAYEVAKYLSENSNGKYYYIADTESGDLLSMNDFVSEDLVSKATGDVIIFNADFLPDSVLAQTKISALLNNKKINLINGIPRSDLVAFKNLLTKNFRLSEEDGIIGVYELISLKSFDDLKYISVDYKITIDKDGTRVLDIKNIDIEKLEEIYKNSIIESNKVAKKLFDIVFSENSTKYKILQQLKIKNPKLCKDMKNAQQQLGKIENKKGLIGNKENLPTLQGYINVSKYLKFQPLVFKIVVLFFFIIELIKLIRAF